MRLFLTFAVVLLFCAENVRNTLGAKTSSQTDRDGYSSRSSTDQSNSLTSRQGYLGYGMGMYDPMMGMGGLGMMGGGMGLLGMGGLGLMGGGLGMLGMGGMGMMSPFGMMGFPGMMGYPGMLGMGMMNPLMFMSLYGMGMYPGMLGGGFYGSPGYQSWNTGRY
ncbi:acanthoscurrin-2-like [Paramacrobiotus metropolitanus]|uniref:acanthoscurrin-2-like n=1 Tax=Paramacrobiotus metropolitanus TaxID=2943436 RepID=UPI002446552F|nr:acanthoscurrin-2-like [Paramacrobiotus metropolitanus]